MAKKSKIFLSHSSKDRNYVDSLILEAQNFKDIELWISSNDKIELGAEFITEIKNAIDESSGAIILVSNNLLNSEFIQEHELPELINRKKNDSQYILVPVLIEDCDWENNQNLEGMQLLNTKSTNLKSLTGTQYSLLVKQIFQSITKNLKEKVIDKKEAKKIKRNKTLRRIAIFSIISLMGFLSANNIFGPTGTDLIEEEWEELSIEEKDEVVKKLTSKKEREEVSVSESVQLMLRLIDPTDCTESNKLSNKFSCNNLLDGDFYFWSDNGNFCKNQWVEFTFAEETYIEFIVLKNLTRSSEFKANYRIKNLEIYTDIRDEFPIRKTLEDDNFEQWIDVNQNLTYLRINMLNGYPSETVEGEIVEQTNNCALEEVRFFGKSA